MFTIHTSTVRADFFYILKQIIMGRIRIESLHRI